MSGLALLIPVALLLGLSGLAAFFRRVTITEGDGERLQFRVMRCEG